jgi:hypothetical protein
MKKTEVQKFDDFFDNASKLLETAEKVRAGLQDSEEDGKELTDCVKLKNYTYLDVVKVLFWSLSSNAKGNIKGTKVGVSEETPFVKLDYFEGLMLDTRNVSESFEAYLKAVVDGPKDLVEILTGLQKVVEDGNALKDSAKDDFKAANLNPLQQGKALAAFGKNMATIAKEIPKIKTLQPLVVQGATDFKALVPKFKEIFQTCDEVGAKAFKEGLKLPKEIFAKYHPGEKKTEEEIEAEKKAADEKKGAKKDKKKDKKDDKKKDKKDDKKDKKDKKDEKH